MKFSVLLPTRNRLEYLKYAVASILHQNYDDWEVIISDNASEENIEEFVQSIRDIRIKYYRMPSFCPVTENWNNAIEKSSGDYVIMLGDDDCLLDTYFSYCSSLLRQYQFPDMIYHSALNYAYPGVIPGVPEGYLKQYGYAPFLIRQKKPFIIDKKEARQLVNKMLNFTVAVNFNMQHSLVSRELIRELKKYGPFYQSPYPDYYATTSLFLKAKRILAVPSPVVVIGITPKSFGYYYFNNKEKEGIDFLKNFNEFEGSKKKSKSILPGTQMNIFWLLAMDTIQKNFSKEYPLKVGYRKFLLLQMLHQCKKYALHENIYFPDMLLFAKHLFLWEKFIYGSLFFIARFIRKRPHDGKKRIWANKMAYYFSHPFYGIPREIPGKFKNIMDVVNIIKIESDASIHQ